MIVFVSKQFIQYIPEITSFDPNMVSTYHQFKFIIQFQYLAYVFEDHSFDRWFLYAATSAPMKSTSQDKLGHLIKRVLKFVLIFYILQHA